MTVEPPRALTDVIKGQGPETPSAPLCRLRDHLMEHHGSAIEAILFYGSCLRSGDDFDGLVDLYVVTSDYRSFYRKWMPAVFNWLLPPNVFYIEVPFQERVVRAKYAVVSTGDFNKGTTAAWFHSYLWGRFAQPSALLYARDSGVRAQIYAALGRAVLTFVARSLPRLPQCFSSEELWTTGLRLSYAAELRSESPERAVAIVEASADYYQQVTHAAAKAIPYLTASRTHPKMYVAEIASHGRLSNQCGWLMRRAQGKLLSVLRLIKGLFTFQGGVDYILWKIERHSGITVEVSPFARRHPLLASWGVFWRLYRRGAFR